MPQTRDHFAYELRDLHGASRSIVYLTLAGSPYLTAVSILTSQVSAVGLLSSVFMGLTGLVCWWRPGRIPRPFWFAAPLIATATISVLNIASHDASSGALLFYLWPVLYAANFLSTRVLSLNLTMAFAGAGLTVFPILGLRVGLADWTAMVLAMSMAAAVVHTLRRRADKLRDVLERQAHADHLTGLANRRYFDEALADAGAWARSTGGELALLTVDLDHFKAINDTFGHAEGDRVLRAVATAMGTAVGKDGVAARLGGDEFVVLLRAGRRTAPGVAEGLCAAVAARTDLPGGPPSLSIGVAVLPGDAGDVDGLVAASDAALYEAKTSGRGRVAVAGPGPDLGLMASSAPAPRP
ncbi:GGDEF domain-containing protein [Actinoplanes sp. NPDC026623]|uniref:GGDEF domain-containing protein n=1 Tax=Actinoplanes sp. NPDC026623 TaxID=3155610 RepID=UPI0033D4DBD2